MYICSASTDLFRCFLEKFAITTYPRKGTETRIHRSFFNVFQCLILQLIPVRGRKKPLELIHGHLNYNLSPQGDGNKHNRILPFKKTITTYPRKGTKTHEPLPLNLFRTLQLIPAREQQSTSVTGILPAAEVLCFILILFTGYRAGVVPAEMVIVTGSALTP